MSKMMECASCEKGQALTRPCTKAGSAQAQHLGFRLNPPTAVVTYKSGGKLRMRSIRLYNVHASTTEHLAHAVFTALPATLDHNSISFEQVCRLMEALQGRCVSGLAAFPSHAGKEGKFTPLVLCLLRSMCRDLMPRRRCRVSTATQ